ncbi:MAG: hypothetical protein K6T85_11615 [Gorillibacterium sp.]|nr:hypothetical protein [Gorillibacterium sp.]
MVAVGGVIVTAIISAHEKRKAAQEAADEIEMERREKLREEEEKHSYWIR